MSLEEKFRREVAAHGLPVAPGVDFDRAPVSDEDLAPLPATAQRYLRFMGVVGRPRDWSFRARFTGRFRRSADDAWMDCEAWQYNTRLAVARLFYMRLTMFGVVPVVGRDTYEDGHGRMQIRPLDLVTVMDGKGEAYDLGELVTYLNDAVTIAPSMLLAPNVTFTEVDEWSFDLAIADHGHTVRARVYVDEQGAPVDFETTDRWMSAPDDASKVTRCKWTTPLHGVQHAGDRRFPVSGKAMWHPEGREPFAYAELDFDVSSLVFDVAPGQ